MPTWTGAISTDWNTAGNWSTPAAVPTAATAAIFTGIPVNNCTTGTAVRACLTLDTTGYLGTLEIGSSTAGYLRVFGNITLGNTVGHITGLANIGIEGATCTLDVASGITVPYLSFGTASGGGGGTTTLLRSFVVTTLRKFGAGTMTVTAGSAMSIDVTNGSISGNTITLNANVTLRLFGTTTYESITINGNVTSQAGSTISLVGLFSQTGGILNLSAGTVIPGTSIFVHAGVTFSLNMGTNELYSYAYTGGASASFTLLSNVIFQSCYFYAGTGGSTVSGAFNITVKGSVGVANHFYPSGKFILTGDGTSADALATFSGTTMTVTAFTLGSTYGSALGRIAIGQTITGPGIPANTVVVAQLTGTANQLGTYQVSNSFTLGSTAIKGVNCAILGGCNTNSIEIDALANAFAYIAGMVITTFRYLSTNTGAYSASNSVCVIGTIDFQGIGSSTRFIRNWSIGSGGIANTTTILSDVWVENLICITFSGILQSGVRKLYVLGNATINNGTTANFVIQPEVVLFGSAPCTFSCSNLNANITIDKVGGTVTNMSNFSYITTTVGIPYTFKLNNGTFIHGPYTTTIGSTAIFNTPGVNWNNITVNNGVSLTINALLRITGILTFGSNPIFAGTAGWDCNNLICTTTGTFNITLQQLVTYRTRAGVSITGGTSANRPTMRSSLANSYAIWTLDFGATQSLIYVNATDIDSSGGQTIWSFGVLPVTNLLRTINWNPGVPLRTVAYTFVN